MRLLVLIALAGIVLMVVIAVAEPVLPDGNPLEGLGEGLRGAGSGVGEAARGLGDAIGGVLGG